MAVVTMREALNQAMREEMARDPDVFLMGEEVGYYQGAYKVTQGLLEDFGEKRVIDTPIAESGFEGVSKKNNRVFGLMARRQASLSFGATYVTSTPNFTRYRLISAMVEPNTLSEQTM